MEKEEKQEVQEVVLVTNGKEFREYTPESWKHTQTWLKSFRIATQEEAEAYYGIETELETPVETPKPKSKKSKVKTEAKAKIEEEE